VPDRLDILSNRGLYSVIFEKSVLNIPAFKFDGTEHFLIDAKVACLYKKDLADLLKYPHTIVIDATEENKSVEQVIPVIEQLLANKVRRDHSLIAIGGGIIQDITCFIASILLRGLTWKFIPTTLLAQCDSCIGSKSSINLGTTKNILGTFNPPAEIFVCSEFLNTLEHKDILSGIGEILKVHAIDGRVKFDQIASDYDELLTDRSMLLRYIRNALNIKKRFIEVDEFDRGIRNIFNYGHSFGHAIESATGFRIPHGIAVAMGMDMANNIAVQRKLLPDAHYQRMHGVLKKNYAIYASAVIDNDRLISALMKDKKNVDTKLTLIFPLGDDAKIERVQVDSDEAFYNQCGKFLMSISK
jgi:3-dehydroquinate synthase